MSITPFYDLPYGTASMPVLNMNFAGTQSLVAGGVALTFARTTEQTYFDSTGTLQTTRINSLRNNTMVGAVVGSPGTAPTNWLWPSVGGNLTTADVAAVGTESGISYVDIRLVASGAVTAQVTFEATTQIVAADTQTWTGSLYEKLSAGTTSNVTFVHRVMFRTAAGASVTSQDSAFVPTSSGLNTQRITNTFTASGGTIARVTNQVIATFTGAGDITLRIGMPQLELGATVSAVIPTYGSAVNSAPAYDYNPSTLAALGLSMWEARTNSLRNNTMVGAVAGTPGTAPTNWATQVNTTTGLTREIVGTGTESGITYIDIKYSGTASGAGSIDFFIEPANQIAAVTGQVWTPSVYLKLAGGGLTGLSSWRFYLYEYTSAPAFITAQTLSLTAPTTAGLSSQRQSGALTLSGGAGTAFIRPLLNVAVANGAAIDFTLRIGMPQLELGAFATPVIATTTAAVARTAPTCSTTDLSWFNATEGTFVGTYAVASDSSTSIFPGCISMNDGTLNNRICIYSRTVDDAPRGAVVVGGATQCDMTVGSVTYGSNTKAVLAYKVNDFAYVQGGLTVQTDTSGTIPTVTKLEVGVLGVSTHWLNGWISSLQYFRQRLPNSVLQAKSV